MRWRTEGKNWAGLRTDRLPVVCAAVHVSPLRDHGFIADVGQAIRIAIGGFGTGFPPIGDPSGFSVDSLKIDRAFVIEMTDSRGLALVSSIINLAPAFKRKVVAEGVETEAQAHPLRGLDCDQMQAWRFSRVLPGELFKTRFLVPSDLT